MEQKNPIAKPLMNSHYLREPGRKIAIYTTAALPWLTGTSVNPLLRAAYLAVDPSRQVTLVIPWLARSDQELLFPHNKTFDLPGEQEAFVREWIELRTGLPCRFRICFYAGVYAPEKGSILPLGDITTCISDTDADVAVLEEPEHLTWYHHGRRFTSKFRLVVGVVHTNYLDYARRESNGRAKAAALALVNVWVCRVHCHLVIKLSDAVQSLPRQRTLFVHGVSPSFLAVGRRIAQAVLARSAAAADGTRESEESSAKSEDNLSSSTTSLVPPPNPLLSPLIPSPPFSSIWEREVYFIGKVLWAKGYTELLDRFSEHRCRTGHNIPVDVYGSGPDLAAVQARASSLDLAMSFQGPCDHANPRIQSYRIFVNPSLSDVVATTSAEAIAMGKWLICVRHPSNAFFSQFPNCLLYDTSEQFSEALEKALKEDPEPLSDWHLYCLTWQAATERFLDVAEPHGDDEWLLGGGERDVAAAAAALDRDLIAEVGGGEEEEGRVDEHVLREVEEELEKEEEEEEEEEEERKKKKRKKKERNTTLSVKPVSAKT